MFGSNFLIVCASSLLVLYAALSYLRNRWTKRGIPFSNVHPLIGNLQDVFLRRKNMTDVLRDFYLQHKSKPYIGFFSFTQPMVMVNDLDLIKAVLIKDFSVFQDRNIEPSPNDTLECNHLFSMKGSKWKILRAKLTPTFTSGKMKKMFELIDACGKNLVACFERERGVSGDLLIKEFFARYSTDVIGTCGFGIEGNSLKDANNTFRTMMVKALNLDWKQQTIFTLMAIFPSLVKKLNLIVTKPDVQEYFRKLVWDNVEYRKKNKIKRNDFLNLLMEIRDKGRLEDDDATVDEDTVNASNEKLDLEGDKFVSQCYLFLIAGLDTSSSTMSHALYEMALHPEVQQRVHKEITSVLEKHEGKITYESVQNMTYLHMVVQETLRKYPVLTFLDRQTTRPYRLPGSAIELAPGESVMIPVIGLHYDPDLYPQPERFDPERFNEENRATRPACTFLGFGDGPRICIGMRLGLLQVKVGLAYTLLNYEFSPNQDTPTPLEFKEVAPFLQVKGGIPLRLKKHSA